MRTLRLLFAFKIFRVLRGFDGLRVIEESREMGRRLRGWRETAIVCTLGTIFWVAPLYSITLKNIKCSWQCLTWGSAQPVNRVEQGRGRNREYIHKKKTGTNFEEIGFRLIQCRGVHIKRTMTGHIGSYREILRRSFDCLVLWLGGSFLFYSSNALLLLRPLSLYEWLNLYLG